MQSLNADQAHTYKALTAWKRSSYSYAILQGAAGTGKSFLLGKLIPSIAKAPLLIAPTNEAVHVMKENIKMSDAIFKTVYSALGFSFVNKDHEKVLKKVIAKPRLDHDLVVVDESSMVEELILKELKATGLKILFVGHASQLPPTSTGELSLNDKCISPVFLEKFQTFSLTQQMRNTNEIFHFCSEAEELIYDEKKKFDFGKWKHYFGSATQFEIDKDSFFEEQTRLICWTNATVDFYNNLLRETIFGNKAREKFVEGDKILLTSPATYFGELTSKVNKKTLQQLESSSETLQTNTRFVVKKVFSIALFNIECFGLDVLLEGVQYTLYVPKNNQEFENAKQILREAGFHLRGKPRENHFKWYHLFCEVFSQVKHSYAITTHRSQGTTIENTIVHWGDIRRVPNPYLRNKLFYVAASRARNSLKCIL